MAEALAGPANLSNEYRSLQDRVSFEEQRRCYWSVILLQRLVAGSVGSLVGSVPAPPAFPKSPTAPPSNVVSIEGQLAASQSSPDCNGILETVIHLSEVWAATQEYVRSTKNFDKECVPWDHRSYYSTAQQKLLGLGRKLPPLHRYRCVKFSNVTADQLEEHREYWAPWICSRFLYHSAICLLNHPLLIALQLQDVRGVPEVFLQQTSFSSSHHVQWMIHFIDFLESRKFRVTDPLLVYCVAVVATIGLQQSFAEHSEVGQKGKITLEKCLGFIESLDAGWVFAQRLVSKYQSMAYTCAETDFHLTGEKTSKPSRPAIDFFPLAGNVL